MKLTDEQYAEIGRVLVAVNTDSTGNYRADLGRAAVAALAPLLLAEPTRDEVRPLLMECYPVCGGLSDFDMKMYRSLFANRLASVTAKPDPAVEAVMSVIGYTQNPSFAEKIVAAVDKARAK